MHLLAILFFAAVAFVAARVLADALDEDGARMWAALLGRPYQVHLKTERGSARIVRLRPVSRPEAAMPRSALPLAA